MCTASQPHRLPDTGDTAVRHLPRSFAASAHGCCFPLPRADILPRPGRQHDRDMQLRLPAHHPSLRAGHCSAPTQPDGALLLSASCRQPTWHHAAAAAAVLIDVTLALQQPAEFHGHGGNLGASCCCGGAERAVQRHRSPLLLRR